MADIVEYMGGRKKYARPQAILFSENPGTVTESGKRLPDGYELGSEEGSDGSFLILSDHNRGPIGIKVDRIEKRERMINGRMRSYHIADKLSISLSWDLLPSRAFSSSPSFDETGASQSSDQYTADGGAGGADLLEWYENHVGPFWVFLSYDNPENFSTNKYGRLAEYSQVVEMYAADFSYSVQKRGATNHDLWNVSITLEEV
jgi:hypothetical protein